MKETTSLENNKSSPKNPKQPIRLRLKRWFFGLGKEFSRVTWMHYVDVIKIFITVIIICAIISVIFLGIDSLYFSLGKK
ncbi:MAG: preprotein translocase subunit SecE [Mycoplasmataceae bacterium]|jgi:preprotein translocase SecE subunit|nr:preprotein translocase subunit SecE [Mycoplasmataceae bacterium]